MTEIEIIKELFVASSSNSVITVTLNNGSTKTGHVEKFDGVSIHLGGEIIQLSSILSIENADLDTTIKSEEENQPPKEYNKYKSSFVHIRLMSAMGNEDVDGILFDYRDGKLVLVTDTAKRIINENDIYEIEEATKQDHDNDRSGEVVFDSNYVLNGFEKALFDGQKDVVDRFLADPSRLESEGYTEEEALMLSKAGYVPVNWEDNEQNRIYNQARRIYTYLRNRNHIAETLFIQYIESENTIAKFKVKALSTLIDILEKESPDKLVEFYYRHESFINGNATLCSNCANALFKVGQYNLVREIINKSDSKVDFSDVLFSLNFLEKHNSYDFSQLPGLNPLDSKVSFKELKHILNLPNKVSCIQLLNLYNKFWRFESFFALLSLFMPYAKEEQQINNLVSDCLKKVPNEQFVLEFLPQFPLLWLEPVLSAKYLSIYSGENKSEEAYRLSIFAKRSSVYPSPNEIENAIIKENYQLFDVIRGNDSILHSLGYSAEEEQRIKEFDIETLKYGTVIEKLLLLEGNRNHVPESTASVDFLRDPVSVCTLLFPILIKDGCGELIYELFNYSPFIKRKLVTLRKHYLRALILLDKSDEYWNEIKDNWLSSDLDPDMIVKGQHIAEEKGEEDLAEMLSLYAEIIPINDFEKALIAGNIFKLRTLATDADYLLEVGYTTDDIKLIQESIRQKIDLSTDDFLSIANRLYLYQKNKNRLAELYYKLALLDNNNLAASGLFSILVNEKRYKEICVLYESHLADSSIDDTIPNNSAYINALYQTGQYNQFYDFWKAKKDNLEIDPILLLSVFLETGAPFSVIEDEVMNKKIKISSNNSDLAKSCIIRLVNHPDALMKDFLCSLFNFAFPEFVKQDLLEIKESTKGASIVEAKSPAAIGINSLLIKTSLDSLAQWAQYLFELFTDAPKRVCIIKNIHDFYEEDSEEFHNTIHSLLLSFPEEKDELPEELKPYLYPRLKSDEDVRKWIDSIKAHPEEVDESTFDIFCQHVKKSGNENDDLYDLLCSLSPLRINYSRKYIDAAISMLSAHLNKGTDAGNLNGIIACISSQMASTSVSIDEMLILYNGYLKAEKYPYAYMAYYTLSNDYQLSEAQSLEFERINSTFDLLDSYSLYSVLNDELSKDNYSEVDVFTAVWSKYLKISDNDATAFEEIKDYYNQPSKWSGDALNSLAKYLICNPLSFLYWRLLQNCVADDSQEIKSNIAYHLLSIEGRLQGSFLLNISDHDLKPQTINLIATIYASESPVQIEKYNETIRIIINKHSEWFYDTETVKQLLYAASRNAELRKDLRAWSSTSDVLMRISFLGSNETLFYDVFFEELDKNLPALNEKFLCGLILNNSEQYHIIDSTKKSLVTSSVSIPYKELVCDILEKCDSSSISILDHELLQLVYDNINDSIDEMDLYKFYVDKVSKNQRTLAIEVITQIGKYYPQLAVIDDVKKYEIIAKNPTDDEILEIYNSEFDLLREIPNPVKAEKVIMNMIPAELYLRSRGIELSSVLDYGVKIISGYAAERIRRRAEMYRQLDNSFDPARYPGLSNLFMKCLFIRRWQDVLEYRLDDTSIDDILKNDSTVQFFLVKKTYDVLKSAVLSILDSDADNSQIIDRADAIFIASGGIRRSKNYLRRLQNMNDDDKAVLKNIFGLRIESKTLRESGIVGAEILQIPRNEEFAYVIGMYETISLAQLFNNDLCRNTLLTLPNDKALAISEIYSTFFYKTIDNVFARYISNQTQGFIDGSENEDPFKDTIDNCREIRKKYKKLKSKADTSDHVLTLQEIKVLTRCKLDYLYNAIIYHSNRDIDSMNPSSMDYLSVIVYLFNRKSSAEIRDYIWNLDSTNLLPVIGIVLTILEQYSIAYEVASKLDNDSWKEPLLQYIYRGLTYGKVPFEEKELRRPILQQIQPKKDFFVGKFIPIEETQNSIYVEKMNALRSFCNELLDYASLNGTDTSWILIDDARFNAALSPYYNTVESKASESTIQPTIESEPSEGSIASIADIDYIGILMKGFTSIKPKDNPSAVLETASVEECIAVLKSIFETKKNSTNPKELLRCRNIIRWIYLKSMENDGYSREYFNHVLAFVSERDSITKAQWDMILFYLNQYFENISSIQHLTRIIENDLAYLRNIGKISSEDIKYLRSEDTKSWNLIVDVLANIAGMDYTRIPENEQVSRLSECRKKLFIIRDNKKSSTFDPVCTNILSLVADQIKALLHSPELAVSIIGEDNNKQQTILWESENDEGELYAVISNIGGAACQDVTVVSIINMSNSRKFYIKTLYPGEKIPLTEKFNKVDLVNGAVTWTLDISYNDAEKDKQMHLLHESKAIIQNSEEVLNLGNISYGNPAHGDSFVGRKSELARLRSRYSDLEQLPSMLVRGLKRSGKSSLIIQFTEELRKKNKILVAFVNGQSIAGNIRMAFIDKVIDNIRSDYLSYKEYKGIINDQLEEFKLSWTQKLDNTNWIANLDSFYFELSHLFNKKLLVVIDEMEAIFYDHRFESVDQEESLYAALRALIQSPNNNVSFIFCGSDKLLTSCLEQRRESQMFQTLQYIEVGRMSFNDIQEIFKMQSKKSDIVFTFDSVAAIWQFTNGLVWYAKLLGYIVINSILTDNLTIRKYVNRADIFNAVQMLINGEIGTDKYDLVDASLSTPRMAIVHAMASIMPDFNKELSVDEIAAALEMMKIEGYSNPRNGEPIPNMNEKEIKNNLDFLEKMQFVDSNAPKTRYLFTADLYRLFFRNDKRLHMFEERNA